jgi:hypothetical protein
LVTSSISLENKVISLSPLLPHRFLHALASLGGRFS